MRDSLWIFGLYASKAFLFHLSSGMVMILSCILSVYEDDGDVMMERTKCRVNNCGLSNLYEKNSD
jgi:hypothetical protein